MEGAGLLVILDMLGNTITQLRAQLEQRDQRIAELEAQAAQRQG